MYLKAVTKFKLEVYI